MTVLCADCWTTYQQKPEDGAPTCPQCGSVGYHFVKDLLVEADTLTFVRDVLPTVVSTAGYFAKMVREDFETIEFAVNNAMAQSIAADHGSDKDAIRAAARKDLLE